MNVKALNHCLSSKSVSKLLEENVKAKNQCQSSKSNFKVSVKALNKCLSSLPVPKLLVNVKAVNQFEMDHLFETILIIIGAIEPAMCPSGYGEKIGALRTTLEDTCVPCKAGTYSNADGSGCTSCRAGVVCLDYATSDTPVSNSSQLADSFGPNGTKAYLCPPG